MSEKNLLGIVKALANRDVPSLDTGKTILCSALSNKLKNRAFYKRPDVFGMLEATAIMDGLQHLYETFEAGHFKEEHLSQMYVQDLSFRPELQVQHVHYAYDAARFLWLRDETEDDISFLFGNAAYSLEKRNRSNGLKLIDGYADLLNKIRYDISAEYGILLK